MITPQQIEIAIDQSTRLESLIDPQIYSLNSPSGSMGRALMNNLAHWLANDLRYLEVGTERGVAYTCVMNGHDPKYSCVIDPWENRDWLKPDFDENITRFLPNLKYNQLNLIIEDCFQVNPKRIKSKINFYFYDAMHDHANQKKAFTYFNDLFDDIFLTVIDDYNDPEARSGTEEAFKELGYTILYGKELPTEYWNMKGGAGNPNTYWNGLGIFLVQKAQKPILPFNLKPIV